MARRASPASPASAVHRWCRAPPCAPYEGLCLEDDAIRDDGSGAGGVGQRGGLVGHGGACDEAGGRAGRAVAADLTRGFGHAPRNGLQGEAPGGTEAGEGERGAAAGARHTQRACPHPYHQPCHTHPSSTPLPARPAPTERALQGDRIRELLASIETDDGRSHDAITSIRIREALLPAGGGPHASGRASREMSSAVQACRIRARLAKLGWGGR